MLLGVVIQQHRGEDQAGDIEGNVNAQEKAAQQDIQKGSEGVPKQVEDEDQDSNCCVFSIDPANSQDAEETGQDLQDNGNAAVFGRAGCIMLGWSLRLDFCGGCTRLRCRGGDWSSVLFD